MTKRYGSTAAHLVGHLALFGLTAYAVVQIFTLGAAFDVVVWLVAAVLFHDVVLWPLYSGGALALGNYVRIPLGLSLLLALVFAGTVTGKGGNAYRNASGVEYEGYLMRWLIVSAALFAVSAVVFAVRRRSA
jgi:hypothetical protein